MSDPIEQAEGRITSSRGLVRDLGLFGAVAVSLAVVGPSMSVSLNPQAMAEQVGGAVPVVYLIALVPIAMIAVAFVVLTRRHGTAGSLYTLVGLELGPKAGAVSGLWLVVAYVAFNAVTAASFGVFSASFLESVFGLVISPAATFVIMGAGLLFALGFSVRPTKGAGHLLLAFEGITMALILITTVLTFITLATKGGPQGQTIDFSEFSLAGVSTGALGLAITYSILSSAGFEGAAAAGEETNNPTRNVPVAIVATALVVNVFYVAVTAVGVWAFGTSPSQMEQFIASASLPGDIADVYVAAGLGDFITLGGVISSLACMIAAQIAGARIIFAFSRDRVLPGRFDRLSPRWSTPVLASAVMAILGAFLVAVFIAPVDGDPFSVFEAVSGFAGVVIMAAYGAACVAAIAVMWRHGGKVRFASVIPGFGVLIVLVVLYFSLFPLPSGWEMGALVGAVATVAASAVAGVLLSARATRRRAASSP